MEFDHAELDALYGLWKKQAGDRLPARAQLSPEALRRWMGHLAIVRLVGPEPRFRVDLVGTRIVELDGVDSTGHYLDEIASKPAVEVLLEPYRTVLETGRPQVHRFTPDHRPLTSVLRLLLPLADDGVTIDRILTGVYADEGVVDRHESVFERINRNGAA